MKKVPGFPMYYATKGGRIFSRFTRRFLNPDPSNKGYKCVSLSSPCGTVMTSIHRIVAITFLPKPRKDRIHINHINGVKSDNRVSNLEWVTPCENAQHAVRTGLIKRKTVKQRVKSYPYSLPLPVFRILRRFAHADARTQRSRINFSATASRLILIAAGRLAGANTFPKN